MSLLEQKEEKNQSLGGKVVKSKSSEWKVETALLIGAAILVATLVYIIITNN